MRKGYSFYLIVKIAELYVSAVGWRKVRGEITQWVQRVSEYRNPTGGVEFEKNYVAPAAAWVASKEYTQYTQSTKPYWEPTKNIYYTGSWKRVTNPYLPTPY